MAHQKPSASSHIVLQGLHNSYICMHISTPPAVPLNKPMHTLICHLNPGDPQTRNRLQLPSVAPLPHNHCHPHRIRSSLRLPEHYRCTNGGNWIDD